MNHNYDKSNGLNEQFVGEILLTSAKLREVRLKTGGNVGDYYFANKPN